MNLKNKNVFITGAGKGIGLAITKNCLNNSSHVFALTRSKSDLKKFKNIKNITIFYGDVRNKKIINKIFTYSKKIKHPINALVNNAGERQRIKFNNITDKQIRHIFDINFFSIFYICQVFCKMHKQNSLGSVINIGSIVGDKGFNELSGYGSTKKALEGLTKCLSVEMGQKKIRFNCINPGFTKTSYYNKFKKKNLYSWTLNKIALNRWAESSEISNLVQFLLSDESSYINGETINIDGGWN